MRPDPSPSIAGHKVSGIPLQIALVDPDEKSRVLVADALQTSITECSIDSYSCARDAVRAIPRSAVDLILTEIHLPDLSGIECVRRLRTVSPRVPIIIFTASHEPQIVWESLLAGASGHLSKTEKYNDLGHTLTRVANGLPVLSQDAQTAMVASLHSVIFSIGPFNLTAGERRIIASLLEGLSDKQIAAKFQIGLATVHTHLAHLYRKLGAHNRNQAIRKVLGLAEN